MFLTPIWNQGGKTQGGKYPMQGEALRLGRGCGESGLEDKASICLALSDMT